MTSQASLEAIELEEERDLYERANLFPRDTGLPMTVWVRPEDSPRHDARIKVCTTHGDRMNARATATVAIRPQPRLVHGELSSIDMVSVTRWIEMNSELLIHYWEGRASTGELMRGLQRV